MTSTEFKNAVPILPGRLFYVALANPPRETVPNKHFFSIDSDLIYWNFYLDFGPLNLGQLYRFSACLNNKLSDARLRDKQIYFYSGANGQRRANAVYLMCSWMVLFLKKMPDEAFAPFKGQPAFPTWHDATPGPCPYQLTILDTLNGLYKAWQCQFFDFANFNIEEYEYFEQVEHGDLSWCLDNKFIMFAGPQNKRESSPEGYHSLCPDDFVPYFKKRNVQLVVRLNKKYYDAKRFTSQGIGHMELYFTDGSNPPDDILETFIQKSEQTTGAIAVHCKAGLGRTGCCIGGYIMKHYQFTAEELIGWLRIVRPGSIIGPQQQFMKSIQNRMWADGDVYRANPNNRVLVNPALGIGHSSLCGTGRHSRHSPTAQGQSSKIFTPLASDKTASASTLPLVAQSSTPTQGVVKDRSSSVDTNSARTTPVNGALPSLTGAVNSEVDTQGDYLRARRYHMKEEQEAAHALAHAGEKGTTGTPPAPTSAKRLVAVSTTTAVSSSAPCSPVNTSNKHLSPHPPSSSATTSADPQSGGTNNVTNRMSKMLLNTWNK